MEKGGLGSKNADWLFMNLDVNNFKFLLFRHNKITNYQMKSVKSNTNNYRTYN